MSLDLSSRSPAGPLPRTAWLLAAAGTFPFLAGAIVAVAFGGAWVGLVQVYGATIAAFVSGIQWVAALDQRRGGPALLVASNVTALVACATALLPPDLGFATQAGLFAALLAIDRRHARAEIWPDWFWRLRLVITGVVVAACLTIVAGLRLGGPA